MENGSGALKLGPLNSTDGTVRAILAIVGAVTLGAWHLIALVKTNQPPPPNFYMDQIIPKYLALYVGVRSLPSIGRSAAAAVKTIRPSTTTPAAEDAPSPAPPHPRSAVV